MNLVSRVGLFAGAYIPLWIFALLFNPYHSIILAIGLGLLVAIGLVVTLTLLVLSTTLSPISIKPIKSTPVKHDYTALLPYLTYFYAMNNLDGFHGWALLMVIMFVLFSGSLVVELNPFLILLGFKAFEVEVNGVSRVVLTRRGFVGTLEPISVVMVNNFLMVETGV